MVCCEGLVVLPSMRRGRVLLARESASEVETLKKEVEALQKDVSRLKEEEEERIMLLPKIVEEKVEELPPPPPLKKVNESFVKNPEDPAFLLKPSAKTVPKTLKEVNKLFSRDRCLGWCEGAQFWEAGHFADAILGSDDFVVDKLEVKDGELYFEASDAVQRFLIAGPPSNPLRAPAVLRSAERLRSFGFFTDVYGHEDFDPESEVLGTLLGRRVVLGDDHQQEGDPIISDAVTNIKKVRGTSLAKVLFKDKKNMTTESARAAFAKRVDTIGHYFWRRWRQGVLTKRPSYLKTIRKTPSRYASSTTKEALVDIKENNDDDDDDKQEERPRTLKEQREKFNKRRSRSMEDLQEMTEDQLRRTPGSTVQRQALRTCFELLDDDLPSAPPIDVELLSSIEAKLCEVALAMQAGSFEIQDVAEKRRMSEGKLGLEERWDAVRFAYRSSRVKGAALLIALDLLLEAANDAEGLKPSAAKKYILERVKKDLDKNDDEESSALIDDWVLRFSQRIRKDENTDDIDSYGQHELKTRADTDPDFKRLLSLEVMAAGIVFFDIVLPGTLLTLATIAGLFLLPSLFAAIFDIIKPIIDPLLADQQNNIDSLFQTTDQSTTATWWQDLMP